MMFEINLPPRCEGVYETIYTTLGYAATSETFKNEKKAMLVDHH